MVRYILTAKGTEYLADEAIGDPMLIDVLYDAQEADISDTYPNAPGYNRAMREALRRGLIVKDRRSAYEIVQDISKYDRDLGRLLKVYVDVGKRKIIRDKNLDEALLIAIERLGGLKGKAMSGVLFPEARTGLRRALRSRNEGDKIAAIDKFVSQVHREGLLWSKTKGREPDVVARDVGILLDRLAE